jgi:hypothetical protein
MAQRSHSETAIFHALWIGTYKEEMLEKSETKNIYGVVFTGNELLENIKFYGLRLSNYRLHLY